jgi:hypothetical protein
MESEFLLLHSQVPTTCPYEIKFPCKTLTVYYKSDYVASFV